MLATFRLEQQTIPTTRIWVVGIVLWVDGAVRLVSQFGNLLRQQFQL